MDAQQALESAYNQIRKANKFSFAVQFFGTYQDPPRGYYVVMVNGTYDLPGSDRYWAFLHNGQYSPTGIDDTQLNPGDTLQFVNEPFSQDKHAKTPVPAQRDYDAAQGRLP